MKILLSLTLGVSLLFAQDFVSSWEQLLNTNSGIKAQNKSLERAQKMNDDGVSKYLPQVSLAGSYTHLSKPIDLDLSEPLNGAIDFINGGVFNPHAQHVSKEDATIDLSKQDVFLADISLLWPLYTGGRISALSDIHQAQVDESEAKVQMSRDKSFILLVKYYYGVIVAKSLHQTRVDVESALKLHYEHTLKMKEQGQIAQVELLNSKAKYERAKVERIKSEHQYDIALSAYRRLLHDAEAEPKEVLFIDSNVKDQEQYTRSSQENFPALTILKSKKEQSKSLEKMAFASYLPTVFAYGNYNLYRDDSIIATSAPDWFAGLAIKIDLISRFGRSQKLDATRLAQSQLELLHAQAQDDLALMVEKTYKEMQLYLDEYMALDSSIELASENVKLRSLAFSEGLSTSLEMIDAELFLAANQTERLNASYNYIQKLSQLLVLAGQRETFFELLKNSQKVQ